MALFDLNRANDTPVATLMLAEIVPDVFPTNPLPMPNTAPINVPVVSYFGGAFGDDVDTSTANATNDYAPRTEAAKAAAMVPPTTLAVDVTRTRGWIGPGDPYTAPVTPVLTSINPATAVHATAAIPVTLTGSGFTKFSVAKVDGVAVPTAYVSPTSLTATVTPAALAGTQLVTVVDHSVSTVTRNFVVT